MRIAPTLTTVACTALLATTARADIPPPKDYVEDCTVEKAQKRTGGACEVCPAGFKDKDACKDKFKDTEFKHECQAYGGSFWDEVWCKPGEPTPAKTEEPEKKAGGKPVAADEKKGCAVGRVETTPLLLLLLLFQGTWIRRRT